MKQPILLIMAAGMGSRYGGMKQVDPVGPGGEAILDYSLYDAYRAGFRRVIFLIRPEMEADFKAHMASAARISSTRRFPRSTRTITTVSGHSRKPTIS